MRKNVFLIFLLLILYKSSFAYYEYDQKLESAYSSLLSLRLADAESLLNQEKIEKPGNDLVKLYSNYIDFIKAFISEERPLFNSFKKNALQRLEELDNDVKNRSSPFHLFVQAEIHIQLALVRVKFEENFLASNDIRKAYKLIEKNEKTFPEFVLNKKAAGFLHSVLGAVPNKYQWIVKLAGMEGDINLGLKEIQNAYDKINKTNYESYKIEILFYLGILNSALSSASIDQSLLSKMKLAAESSPLISYVYTNILMKQGKNEEACQVLSTALLLPNCYSFPFLYYKRGMTKLRKLDLSSRKDFEYFLQNYKGNNNIKSAYQKIAWIALLNNDTTDYFRNMQLCKWKGIALLDEDKEAAFDAENGEVVNVYLLRSRLLFDGGYYNEARLELSNRAIRDFRRYHDQLEVTYRLGRIMQLMGRIDKAVEYFQQTIKNGSSSPYFYAANSSLMLGLIYEELKNYKLALYYFEKCLSIEHAQYKNSIDQKAQAGINRIKNIK